MTHTHTNKRAEGSVRADRNFREGVSPSRIPGGAPPAAAVAGHCPQRRNPATPQPRAFTLVELLVVVSIIVILLGLVATMAPLDQILGKQASGFVIVYGDGW